MILNPKVKMMQGERLIPLAQISEEMPQIVSRQVHPGTLWRWCREGYYGIYLEHVYVGRTIMTSREAIWRFAKALTSRTGKHPPFGGIESPKDKKRRLRQQKRRNNKRRQEGNMAAVNSILVNAGILKRPEGAIAEESHD